MTPVTDEDHTTVVRDAPLGWATHWQWFNATLGATRGVPPRIWQFVPKLPPGLHLDAVQKSLATLVDRHEVLRTVYRTGPDGVPRQHVLACAPVGIGRFPIPADAGDVSASEAQVYLPETPDLTHPPVLRAAVGTCDGEVKHLLVAVPEIAVDIIAESVLRSELEHLLHAAATAAPIELAAPGGQPADHALEQRTTEVQEGGNHAQQHWRSLLAAAPHSTVPIYYNQHGRPDQTSLTTVLASRLLADTAHRAARRYRSSINAVLLTMTGLLITAWTTHPRVLVELSVANRRHERSRPASVGRYAGLAPVLLDFEPESQLADVLYRTFTAQVQAQRHARHDVAALTMLRAHESLRRGARFATSVTFDMREPRSKPIREKLPSGDRQIVQRKEPYDISLLQMVVRPYTESISLELRAPSWLLPADTAVAALQQIEAMVADAADADLPTVSTLTSKVDLPAPWFDQPGWVRLRHAWVNLTDCTRLLLGHPDVAHGRVFAGTAQAAEDATLTAYVTPHCAGLTPANLREHMRDVVSSCPAAFVPHHYVVCDAAPRATDQESQWRAQPVLAAGTGVEAGPAEPTSQREHVLAQAIAAYHPGVPVRMNATYAELPGEFLTIPAILDRLRSEGYQGVRFGHLIGMASLRRVATHLVEDHPPAP